MQQIMTGEFYLIVHPKGWSRLSGRLTATLPDLQSGEVAIKLNVSVPDSLFKKPLLQASVTIPESSVTPPVLNAEVLDNVKEILEQKTGMEIEVRLVEQEG